MKLAAEVEWGDAVELEARRRFLPGTADERNARVHEAGVCLEPRPEEPGSLHNRLPQIVNFCFHEDC